ncbi:hypothetical protein AMR72_10115 [Flavobacterium psychrophilum]|nr:hypothetical protein AMR72_10115 [Flavobacterium psychrophilum]AOE52831.1 hypothetical protein ALW18_10105 [Flavobacterium psychrophilum]
MNRFLSADSVVEYIYVIAANTIKTEPNKRIVSDFGKSNPKKDIIITATAAFVICTEQYF